MGYLAESKDSAQLGQELEQLRANTGWSMRKAADFLDKYGAMASAVYAVRNEKEITINGNGVAA